MKHTRKEWKMIRFVENNMTMVECEASHLSKRTPVSREDLIEVGRSALIQSFHAFQEGYVIELNSFSKLCTKRAMWKYVGKEMRYMNYLKLRPELPPDASIVDKELLSSHFTDSLKMATPSVKEVINLIFSLPVEFCKIINDNKPKKARGFLRHHLHQEMGYSHRKVSTVFKEVKSFLSDCHGI